MSFNGVLRRISLQTICPGQRKYQGNVVNQTPSDDGLIIEGGVLFDACVQV